MARKTYRTYRLRGLNMLLSDKNGERIEVIFRGGIQVDSTARFSTDDEKVQKAIEASHGFGRDFYIESEQSEEPVSEPVVEKKAAPKKEEEPLTDVKDSRRFKNLVEMKNAIKELGIELPENANYLDAKAAAKKEGYDFQIKR